jgi:hypothetical protein
MVIGTPGAPKRASYLKCQPNPSQRAEGKGFEPANDFDATGTLPCGCVICDECRAANALQIKGTEGHCPAAVDPDLQFIAEAWAALPVAQRKAIVVLVGGASAPSQFGKGLRHE